MDDIFGLEHLKISAFSKLRRIQGSVHEITIGPNATRRQDIKVLSKPKETTPVPSPTVSVENDPYETFSFNDTVNELLRQQNTQRQEELRRRIQQRVQTVEDFSKKQEEKREREWLEIQQRFIQDVEVKELHIMEALNEYDRKSHDEHAELVKHYQDLAARRKQQEHELQQKELQKKLLQVALEKIKKTQQEFRMVYQQIIPVLKKCVNTDQLKNELGEDFKLLKILPQKFEELTTRCREGKMSETDVQQAAHMLNKLINLHALIEGTVEKINTEKQKEQEAQQVVQPKPVKLPETTTPVVSAATTITFTPPAMKQPGQTPSTIDSVKITRYISLTNLKIYSEVMTFFDNHHASFKNLENDVSLKQFKFDCKKAVNIPVNSLSGVNAEHIQDKYNKLFNLLKGNNVRISDKIINVSQHPQGVAFCMDLLAKKFVLQSDLMISCNPESAFCYATVMASLWNDFPDFGKLLLAYFYKSCPYLLPYYIPKEVGDSDEEFYKKRGYQYTDGQIEKHDKFLKRMTGIMRLYSALLIVKPKTGQKSTPHTIAEGWRWLGSILKLEPQIDITATMLHTFLETVGFNMEILYRKNFQKLIRYIAENFVPKCRDKSSGGATVRLELLLTEYYKNKKFEEPPGYINHSYW